MHGILLHLVATSPSHSYQLIHAGPPVAEQQAEVIAPAKVNNHWKIKGLVQNLGGMLLAPRYQTRPSSSNDLLCIFEDLSQKVILFDAGARDWRVRYDAIHELRCQHGNDGLMA